MDNIQYNFIIYLNMEIIETKFIVNFPKLLCYMKWNLIKKYIKWYISVKVIYWKS
jgi:hypothetical protein